MNIQIISTLNCNIETIFKMPSFKKEYTITSEKDRQDIENGRCPDYALYWPEETNNQYWPPSHNYYKGFKEDHKDDKEEHKLKEDLTTYYKLWRQIENRITEKKALNKPQPIIFCSLSLLVCDIDDDPIKLNLSKYGRQLWEVIKQLFPFIVVDKKHYTKAKKEWCKLKLETINIVTYDIIIRDEADLENPFILLDYEDTRAITNPNKIFIQYTNIYETLNKLVQNM